MGMNKTCGHEGCRVHPSFGLHVAGGRKAEFCFKHARAGMVNVGNKTCREKGCSELSLDEDNNFDEKMLCRQGASALNTAAVSDTSELNIDETTPVVCAAEGDGGSIAEVRGVKRKRAALSGTDANDSVGARRSSCAGSREGEKTPTLLGRFLLLPGHRPSRADDEVYSRAGAGAGMKIELAVPSPKDGGDRMRKSAEQASPSRGWSSERGSSRCIGNCGEGTGRLCDSLIVVPGCLGTFDYVALEKVEEDPNVKLELGVRCPAPPTSDT